MTYIHRYAVPLVGYLGKKIIEGGKDWVRDVVLNDEPPKKALKRRLLKTAKSIADDSFEKLDKKIQSGSGIRRRRRRKVKKIQEKIKPKSKPRKKNTGKKPIKKKSTKLSAKKKPKSRSKPKKRAKRRQTQVKKKSVNFPIDIFG